MLIFAATGNIRLHSDPFSKDYCLSTAIKMCAFVLIMSYLQMTHERANKIYDSRRREV